MRISKYTVQLLTAILLVGGSKAQASCQEAFANKIKTPLISDEIKQKGVPLAAGGYVLGSTTSIIIGGSAAATLAGFFGVPLLVVSGIEATKQYRNKQLLTVLRLLEQSQYITGSKTKPALSVDYKSFLATGEVENLEDENKKIKKHNLLVAKANAEIQRELGKTELTFIKFYNKLAERVPGLTVEQLAQVIEEENNKKTICDGTVGLHNKEVLIERDDMILELSGDKKEARKQKKHNRKVKRHNKKVKRQQERTLLANKKELLNYLSDMLDESEEAQTEEEIEQISEELSSEVTAASEETVQKEEEEAANTSK
jgi:hypothetical protein